MTYFIGIDIGGTFTDCVVLDKKGSITPGKSQSTPSDLSIGILNSVKNAAESLGISLRKLLSETEVFAHSCTTATNAFLTQNGAKTGLITTAGFEDTILIMRAMGRWIGLSEEQIKHVTITRKPEPIIPKPLIKGVKERIDYNGVVIIPLDREGTIQAIKDLADKGVQAIAVSLLWSPANPVHEREIKKLVAEMYPDIFVTISSDLIPIVGEYERTSTTAINAYIGPVILNYLVSLEKLLKANGFRYSPLIMQAYGGCVRMDTAVQQPVGTMSSGPTAGVIGSSLLAKELGYKNIITTDVGGTSFDVGLIYDGLPQRASETVVGQYHLMIPIVEVKSIGAGGGSLAWLEPVTGIPKVGPKSAGAVPGPACYDLGGTEPTVTDADLVLGYINPDYFLGGRIKLYKEKSVEAIKTRIADPLGMSVVEAASGIYDIVNAQMSDLIRSVTVSQGYDPRECVLFAYGGAGPLHAPAYGRGTRAIIVPSTSSVHCAMGTLSADIMHSYELGALKPVPVDVDWFNKNFEELEMRAIKDLGDDGFADKEMKIQRFIDMRYKRQVHEVTTPVPPGRLNKEQLDKVYAEFEKLYAKLFGKGAGYREAGMQVVTFRLEARAGIRKPSFAKQKLTSPDPSGAVKMKRKVFLRKYNGFTEVNIYDFGKLQPGNIIKGPTIIETPVTTILIDADQSGRMDEYRNIILTEKGA